MRVRVLGGGFYGCHIALALIEAGCTVELHETADRIMGGASGNIPARLHQGFHYPRSRMTRAACQEHVAAFMGKYGFLTRPVPINLYAIAQDESLVDFDQYVRTLRGEVDFVPVYDPWEYGLKRCEGAILTGERHIVTDQAREFFEESLRDVIRLKAPKCTNSFPNAWDWTIDCTFCANDAAGVDRYEPCLVVLMTGPVDTAITVMDGPFGSLYPWNEELSLVSLSSAKWTPFSKTCRTYDEARGVLDRLTQLEIDAQAQSMIESMAVYYPAILDRYLIADQLLSIRAMPASGADSRLVDVQQAGEKMIRVRAGKIDAIIHAADRIKEMIGC